MRRAFLTVLAYASLSCMPSLAQPYPTRPITLIVPYGAGGPLDTLTRIVSERMRVSLGQPIVIDNVTGASGVIGVGRAVRADPDGYMAPAQQAQPRGRSNGISTEIVENCKAVSFLRISTSGVAPLRCSIWIARAAKRRWDPLPSGAEERALPARDGAAPQLRVSQKVGRRGLAVGMRVPGPRQRPFVRDFLSSQRRSG
jgi:Tripartite tricarboxylate transporter family receptor